MSQREFSRSGFLVLLQSLPNADHIQSKEFRSLLLIAGN